MIQQIYIYIQKYNKSPITYAGVRLDLSKTVCEECTGVQALPPFQYLLQRHA